MKAAGLSTSQANRYEAIADLPESEFEGYLERKRRENKVAKISEIETAALAQTRHRSPTAVS